MKTSDIEGVLALRVHGGRSGEGKVEKEVPFLSLAFLSESCQKGIWFPFPG